MERIASALDDDEMVERTIDAVYESYAKRADPLAWRVFTGQANPEEEQRWKGEQEARFQKWSD
jgi:hypothetical protein